MQRFKLSTIATLSTGAFLSGCVLYLDPSQDAGDEAHEDSGASVDADTDDGDSDDGDSDDGDPDVGEETYDGGTDDGDPTDTTTGGPADGCASAIDVLFVIDNSGSMGEEQAQLVTAIGSMVDTFDLAGLDWRIAVTTTDNGNVWCPAGSTSPEAGNLIASSCRDRLDDFLFSDTVDVQDVACNDVCAHDDIEIASTVIDGQVQDAGPWVQRIGGVANTFTHEGDDIVPLDPVEALRCILPQGVNGCGFEAQLESMHLAIARSLDPDESNFGFLRPEAQLAVVIISDETDCSYDKDWSDIFDPDGNKAFWSDPTSAFPTSALCWNAGMECIGEGPEYEDCVAKNKDIDGSILPDGDNADAVLHPLARYSGALAEIEAAKQQLDPDAEVRVFGIVGVDDDGEIQFADSADPNFQASFGIGASCTGNGGATAVPPGRMREVIDEFDGSMHSVCNPQYVDAFKLIANQVTAGCGE